MTSSPSTSATRPAAEDATLAWAMHTTPSASASKTLVIIGEAPGAEEEQLGKPFVGSAGRQLSDTMKAAGLDRDQWHILNTFIQRPPDNDLSKETPLPSGGKDFSKAWFLNKTQFKSEYGYVPLSPAYKKRYLRPELQWQITELQTRLRALKPHLILAMGATALWALTEQDAITQWRGNFFTSPYGKAIATLHPASILYQYSNLPILWADLVKVRLWLEGSLTPPMRRRLWINPSEGEIAACYARFAAAPESLLGVDIETCPSIDQITTISFATESEGICIPVWDRHAGVDSSNVYPSALDELSAWKWMKKFAELPNPKVMQNGLYDAQYLMDAPIEIRLKNWADDTSLASHSWQPELPKALGMLASLHLNEPSWKQMRASAKDAKADE